LPCARYALEQFLPHPFPSSIGHHTKPVEQRLRPITTLATTIATVITTAIVVLLVWIVWIAQEAVALLLPVADEDGRA
jgi:hypothetical protein